MVQQNTLAIDFAVMMLSMCSADFFPKLELGDEELREHEFSRYFLEKGYSLQDIRSFIDRVRKREYQTAVEILNA